MSWWSSSKKEAPAPAAEGFSSGSGGGNFDYNFNDQTPSNDFASANNFSAPTQSYGSDMAGGLSAPSGGSSSQEALQMALLQEQQRLEVQQAVAKIGDLCFEKCVSRPSDKLSSSEQSCIANCAERYLDATMFITGRLMKQHQGTAGGQ